MALKSNVNTAISSREQYKRLVTLLSHGYADPKAFPEGQITVYPWDSSIDEWVRSQSRKKISDKLFTLELVKMLCDLNGCKFENFVVGDASTVILIARSIRHNSHIIYSPQCPFCKAVNPEETVTVPDALDRVGEKPANYPGFDIMTLPVSKDVIKVRPLIVNDEIMLEGRGDQQKKQVSDELAHIICGVIEVGGGQPTSLEELLAWHNALHPQDQAFLAGAVENISPHLSADLAHTCDFCQKHFKFTLPLEDREFFRAGGPTGPKG